MNTIIEIKGKGGIKWEKVMEKVRLTSLEIEAPCRSYNGGFIQINRRLGR